MFTANDDATNTSDCQQLAHIIHLVCVRRLALANDSDDNKEKGTTMTRKEATMSMLIDAIKNVSNLRDALDRAEYEIFYIQHTIRHTSEQVQKAKARRDEIARALKVAIDARDALAAEI